MTASTRHTEATRRVILEAAAALFLERKSDRFSVQEVADRAGVTHRTVYRYFPTRQALLAATAFHSRLGHAEGLFRDIETLEEWIEVVTVHFKVTEENMEMVRSVIAAILASDDFELFGQGLPDRDTHRWEVFRRQLSHLDDDDARQTFAALRHVMSSTSYLLFRLRFGLSPAEATETIQAVASAIVEQAARRDRAANRRGENHDQ
ncbi:MAG TPA: helix-turn-helix domain-containing protein [Acidimicrobiia bacterium]